MIFHNIAVQHAPATPRYQVPQEAAKKALAWSSGVAVDVGTVNPVQLMDLPVVFPCVSVFYRLAAGWTRFI